MYVLSRFLKVENKDRYKTANENYYLIKAETGDFLFTESDLEKAISRASRNREDIPNITTTTQQELEDKKNYYKSLCREYNGGINFLKNSKKSLENTVWWYKLMIVVMSIMMFIVGTVFGLTTKIFL